MTTMDRFEAVLPELIADLGRGDTSELVRDVLAATATMPQRGRSQTRLAAVIDSMDVRWAFRRLPTPARIAIGLTLLLTAAVAFAAGSSPNRVVQPSPSPTPTPSADLGPTASGPLERTQPLAFGSRHSAAAIALTDGRVLVLGGADPRAEIYDPATGEFAATGAMPLPRLRPMLALLRDGRVLVVGGMHVAASGYSDGIASATAEIFDPATGTFQSTGPLHFGRWTCCFAGQINAVQPPAAISLLDGRVLIVGGRQQDPGSGSGSDARPAQAEIFDPATGTFQQIDVGCDAARGQVRLRDGRVLVTCLEGPAGGETNRARIFDPTTDTFSETGRPKTLSNGTAALTRDGRALLIGVGSAEIYDPATGAFHDLGISRVPNPDQPAVTLSDGGILFVGSDGQRWFYFGATEDRLTWYGPASSFSDTPSEPAAVLLHDGRVLVVGNATYGVLYR